MINLSVKMMVHKANCIDCSLTALRAAKSFELDLNQMQLAKLPQPHVWSSHKFCRHTDLIQCNERAAGEKLITGLQTISLTFLAMIHQMSSLVDYFC